MITYDCYDIYGNKVFSIQAESPNFKRTVIEKDGQYYQPICYDLSDGNKAKCTPIAVLRFDELADA